jgi:hypothetical protein
LETSGNFRLKQLNIQITELRYYLGSHFILHLG